MLPGGTWLRIALDRLDVTTVRVGMVPRILYTGFGRASHQAEMVANFYRC